MIARALMLLLGLTALAGSPSEVSDGVSEAVADIFDILVEEGPERTGDAAEILIGLYEGNKHLRDENILQCLRKVQRCRQDAAADSPRSLCLVIAQNCRTLALVTLKPSLLLQIDMQPARMRTLYKTLDLCSESFDVSQLREAAATDAHLALALRHMEEKEVSFSSYCFVDFFMETGSRTLSFDPGRFEKGMFLGSPSSESPSYQVTIDEMTGQVTLGHYQK
ncbi:MAG: hypothetical protein ACOZAM_27325 [Pseudomonadota bacterium]